jgi:rSAM/selenodomain-associated transferase 1
MTALLIIFAKEPRPGHVKTRLIPPLSPEAAALLYHNFLFDILEEMSRVPYIRLALAYSPPGARSFFQTLAAPDIDLFPQERKDLGERMARACARGFAAGYSPVLLRGSDTPDLPAAVVAEAHEVLAAKAAQVVLGPATDGGYYLVGLASPQPHLFQGPVWSSSTVLEETLVIARRRGLAVHLLPAWTDIDTTADLIAFKNRAGPKPQPGWRSRLLILKLGLAEDGNTGRPMIS